MHLGLARQSVGLELGDLMARKAQHIAVGGQDVANAALEAQRVQLIQRSQVINHVAVWRTDHGGAAVQDVVAAEQQRILFQQKTQVVGRMAGREDGLQCMRNFAVWPLSSQRNALSITQRNIGFETAIGPRRGG